MSVRVYIRHGIFSNPANMNPLQEIISNLIPGSQTDNNSYADYKETILFNGIMLAKTIIDEFSWSKNKGNVYDILLVGHSQGGLLCRVATVAICAPQQLEQAILTKARYIERDSKDKCLAQLRLLMGPQYNYAPVSDSCAQHIFGVVTLATPNAGAVTNAQLSLLGRGVRNIAARLFSGVTGQKTVDELTTGRLFRILQHVRVARVKYLSISGSSVNRYSLVNQNDLELIPKIAALGLHLELPNDGIVEDESVDLRESPLPCEVEDLDKQYTHIRSYTDCLDISHVTIHSRQEVAEEMGKIFRDWRLI